MHFTLEQNDLVSCKLHLYYRLYNITNRSTWQDLHAQTGYVLDRPSIICKPRLSTFVEESNAPKELACSHLNQHDLSGEMVGRSEMRCLRWPLAARS